jgi:Asp-tRNA(Asn)/Glu-tRNA(Gln) amidotransferase A subunit family amidase
MGYWVRKAEVSYDLSTLERLIQAHAEAIAKFYADKATAIRAYLAYDPQSSAAGLARSYDLMAAHNVFERVPYVLKRAVAAVDQQTGPAPEQTADFRPAVDNSIVDRLAMQGFFVKLFGRGVEAEQKEKAALAFR